MTTAKPEYATPTLFYTNMQLAATLPLNPVIDLATTINHKRAIQPTATPSQYPTKILYVGVGRGGAQNANDGCLQYAKPSLAQNGDLYAPLPVRCRLLTDDLTAAERTKYRMRQVVEINQYMYALYWLKVISYTDQTLSFTQTDAKGLEVPYTYDYANMSPTAPVVSTNGVVTDTTGAVSASASIPVYFTADEIQEVVSVFDNGNINGAIINEIGLYQGEDRSVKAYDATNTEFTMTEAIYTQLAYHYTSQNVSFTNNANILDMALRISQDKGISGSSS